MRTCKYCGGLIGGDGFGFRKLYCSSNCWKQVNGFDAGLKNERKKGKLSLDSFVAKGGDVSDKGSNIELLYDRLDGTEPKYNPKMDLGEVMRVASDIHPLLPSALVLIGKGMTQEQAAKQVKMAPSNLAQYKKQLNVKFDM